jgi:hypothetical protein
MARGGTACSDDPTGEESESEQRSGCRLPTTNLA